jgi:hypothetical protein
MKAVLRKIYHITETDIEIRNQTLLGFKKIVAVATIINKKFKNWKEQLVNLSSSSGLANHPQI